MNNDRARVLLKTLKEYYTKIMPNVIPLQREDEKGKNELIQALDIAIESLEHQVNEKDEIKLVCPKCKREWTKPIGEFCSSCGTEMVVEPYERKELENEQENNS